MVIEGVEVHFDEDEGHVRIDCAEEDFARLRDLVLAETPAAERIAPFHDGICSIVVRRAAASPGATPGWSGRWWRIGLIATAIALAMAIQVIGLVYVARWLLGFP